MGCVGSCGGLEGLLSIGRGEERGGYEGMKGLLSSTMGGPNDGEPVIFPSISSSGGMVGCAGSCGGLEGRLTMARGGEGGGGDLSPFSASMIELQRQQRSLKQAFCFFLLCLILALCCFPLCWSFVHNDLCRRNKQR